MSYAQAMNRLHSVISQIQHGNKSRQLLMHECSGIDSNKKEARESVSNIYSSHQMGIMNPKIRSRLEPTKTNINKIEIFPVPHLDDQFQKKLHRYSNTWIRSHNTGTYNGFVGENDVVLFDIVRGTSSKNATCFKRSGARKQTVWAKNEVKAAIVTCGGLCPGLNNVIGGLVDTLYLNYGVDQIFGIKAGYTGFWHESYRPWTTLTPKNIQGITELGGSIIQSDRGGFREHEDDIIDSLLEHGVNQLYIIGGDGTHRGAHKLQKEIEKRRLKITVVGVPKTIDNDIGIIDRSFGFNSSVAKGKEAIISAVTEARCLPNCIGLVKLMGRHAGYIAAHATLASPNIDLCMIPEVNFKLVGPNGILPYLHSLILKKGFAVVVVAEGAGANMIKSDGEKDAGGNLVLPDIGNFLKTKIKNYFKDKLPKGQKINIKYHDPSYMIRSVPATSDDATLCRILSSNAVHGAMAGYTGFTSGIVNGRSVMIPITVITETSPSYLNNQGRTWERVVTKTHQPSQS